MRKVKASDFESAYEYENAKMAERKASKSSRVARTNGRGRGFQVKGDE